jgi:DNA polymerase III epsilon subunit-like protein
MKIFSMIRRLFTRKIKLLKINNALCKQILNNNYMNAKDKSKIWFRVDLTKKFYSGELFEFANDIVTVRYYGLEIKVNKRTNTLINAFFPNDGLKGKVKDTVAARYATLFYNYQSYKKHLQYEKIKKDFKTKLDFFLLRISKNFNYIIIDCEFNYNPAITSRKQEIIQIGLVKLNKNFKVIDKMNLCIKPISPIPVSPNEKRKQLLYNVNRSDITLPDAMDQIDKWLNHDIINVLCTWSGSDIPIIKDNCKYYGSDFSKLQFKNHIDLQKAFCKNPLTLSSALRVSEIQIKQPLHNAINDAVYTAQLFTKIPKVNLAKCIASYV